MHRPTAHSCTDLIDLGFTQWPFLMRRKMMTISISWGEEKYNIHDKNNIFILNEIFWEAHSRTNKNNLVWRRGSMMHRQKCKQSIILYIVCLFFAEAKWIHRLKIIFFSLSILNNCFLPSTLGASVCVRELTAVGQNNEFSMLRTLFQLF